MPIDPVALERRSRQYLVIPMGRVVFSDGKSGLELPLLAVVIAQPNTNLRSSYEVDVRTQAPKRAPHGGAL